MKLPSPGCLCAIDAEFVQMAKQETEIKSDGSKSVLRPARLSLARVSVLDEHGDVWIDEWICTTEPVSDYLTSFSGIKGFLYLIQLETLNQVSVPFRLFRSRVRINVYATW